MKSNYKRFGDYIHKVDERNSQYNTNLQGLSMTKEYRSSTSNIVGTDLSNYKVMRKNRFVCDFMSVIRVYKLPVVLHKNEEIAIVSPAYTTFEINDITTLLPEYLMLWFRRPEFDRYAFFKCDSAIRGGFDWEALCDCLLPVPPIEEQQKIVDAYQKIESRIALKKKINENLEAQATTIFRQYIAKATTESSIYDILSVINGAAFSSEYFNTDNIGLPLVRIRDLKSCISEVWTNEILTNAEYIHSGDILIGMDGEFVPYIWYGAKSLLNQRVCKVLPKQGIHPFFLYATLKPILAEIERTQGGTTVIHLGKKDFDKMVCFNIDNEKHREFSNIIEPIYSLIIKNNQEILTLLETQKSILSYLSR